MAQDREQPCKHYICMAKCELGRDANHWRYCQHCDKYIPRAKVKHKNRKKEKLFKIFKKEDRW